MRRAGSTRRGALAALALAGDGWAAGRAAARAAGRSPSSRVYALVRFEAERAQSWFERGMQLAPLLDRRSAACVLAMAGIYRRLLERIEADPERVLARARLAAGAREGVGGGPQLLGGSRELVSAPRVVVVGGGLAGIAAALDCADGGAQVTLVEVRRRLGGAAYSFERDGLEIDNGQHVFLRCCTAYRALLARLGSELARAAPAAPARSPC